MEPVICPNRRKVIHRQNLASMRDSGRFHKKIANTRKVLRKIRKKKGRRVKGTPAGFPQRFASAPLRQHKAPRGGKAGTPENRTSCRFRQPGHAYPNPCSMSTEHPSPTLPTREGETAGLSRQESRAAKGKTAVPLRYMPQAASTSKPGKVPRTCQNGPPAAFEALPKG